MIDPKLVDLILSHQLDLLRFEAGARTRVLAILNRLQVELTRKLANETLTEFSKARTQTLLREATAVIDRAYAFASGELEMSLRGAAGSSAGATAQALQASLTVELVTGMPTQAFMGRIASNTLIMGAKSSAWWARQAGNLSFTFANAVRQGMVAGETSEQIVRRIAGSPRLGITGVMDVSRSNARSLVHTSIQAVAAEARREVFRKNSDLVTGIRQVSTFDSHTTEICIAYNGQEWDLETEVPLKGSSLPYNGGVPRHWACRSVEVPITKTFRQLGIDVDEVGAGERASTAGPVSSKTSFAQFLERQGVAFQDETLGPGRAQLWRDGKLTLPQLLDLRGNPLTLQQLQRKYG